MVSDTLSLQVHCVDAYGDVVLRRQLKECGGVAGGAAAGDAGDRVCRR